MMVKVKEMRASSFPLTINSPTMPPPRPARLELFKFTLYVFFPIITMLHFGDPDWYDKYVTPLRDQFNKSEIKQVEPPQTPSELKAELERLRGERLLKRSIRDTQQGGTSVEGRLV